MPTGSWAPDPVVVEAARSFVPRVIALADQIESERRLPMDLVDDLRSAGLFRLYLPLEFGGTEASPFTVVAVAEELAKADASTAWCVNVANQAAWLSSRLSVEGGAGLIGADSILLGSGMPTGKAEPCDGGYRLKGTWTFASGAPHATVFSALALDPAGDPTRPSLNAFLPASDCVVKDTWFTTGMRGTGSHDFEIDDVFVPANRVVSNGPSLYPRPLFQVPYLRFVGRGGIALGVARRALDAFIELATTKKQLGSVVSLSEQERFQIGLAECEASWGSARAWLYETLTTVWEALVAGDDLPYERRAQLGLATAHATQSCRKVVEDLYRMGGTTSIKTTWLLDRCLRDLLTASADASVGGGILASAGRAYMNVGPPAPLF